MKPDVAEIHFVFVSDIFKITLPEELQGFGGAIFIRNRNVPHKHFREM
jgi:hypothetical protein